MTTHLALDDRLIQEALIIGHHKRKKAVVIEALQEYIQRRKQQEILKSFNTIEYADEINSNVQQHAIQKVINDFYALPISKIETIETSSVYQGKVLSLDDMEQAIEYEASLYQ